MKFSLGFAVVVMSLLVVLVAARPHQRENRNMWKSQWDQGRPISDSSEEQWPVDDDSNGKCFDLL